MNWLRKMSTNVPSSATSGYKRRASHAGSWYESNSDELDKELEGYLSSASEGGWAEDEGVPNACISPHAGFSYSGEMIDEQFIVGKVDLTLGLPRIRSYGWIFVRGVKGGS